MNRIAKRTAQCVLALSLLSATAVAQENASRTTGDEIAVGQGVVCDTAQQVQRFSALMGELDNIERAIVTVNTEVQDPRACGLILAAFVRGGEVGEVHNANKSLKVVEITILAVLAGNQWHSVSPLKQYTAFAPKGVEI